MKYLAWFVIGVNLYIGLRNGLNVIHVLQTTKYSQAATAVFAVLFLGMGAAGVYLLAVAHDPRRALIVGAGPWVLAVVVLLFSMLTGRQQ